MFVNSLSHILLPLNFCLCSLMDPRDYERLREPPGLGNVDMALVLEANI